MPIKVMGLPEERVADSGGARPRHRHLNPLIGCSPEWKGGADTGAAFPSCYEGLAVQLFQAVMWREQQLFQC